MRAHHRHGVVLQVDAVEAARSRVRPGAAVADERVQRAVAELYEVNFSRDNLFISLLKCNAILYEEAAV